MIVEHDETNDEEQWRIARFLTSGCSCKLLDGIPCSTQFTALMLQEARDECRQLTTEQLDKVVMGKLHALRHRDPLTQKNKVQNSERNRTLTPYHFQGHHVCRDTFVLSIARLKTIKQHEMENRMSPRGRAKVLPHNTTKLSDIKECCPVHPSVRRGPRHSPSWQDTWLQEGWMTCSYFHHRPQSGKCGNFTTAQHQQTQTQRPSGLLPFLHFLEKADSTGCRHLSHV